MAFKELPKDSVSEHYEREGLDVHPVKAIGLDWFRLNVLNRFTKRYSVEDITINTDVPLPVNQPSTS